MSELSDALRAQRIEIAGEVHDRIIPPLFAARMQLEALAARIAPSGGTESPEPPISSSSVSSLGPEIQRSIDFILLAITKSRQLLTQLAPHDPGPKHWDTQLRQALGGRNIQLHQVGSLPWDRIDPELAITLTSITEEAIRNAVRHGEPSRIEIRAERARGEPTNEPTGDSDQESCRIRIIDDGKGFDSRQTSEHHGLHLMRLRSTAIGGQLTISSRPGGPTEVAVQWPLPRSPAAD